ncbi:hypothetical protein CLAVI_000231 [Candidatus Clavichlamydia salmonicola]|uniref:hypothetical protein n=1 Tax=Candidatus Clavichlamydia salmonicola TaxID=469812 RepID=UPI001890D35D|nr:hypothetical protein [Candidatus Clavichlamydia salmonicola]MBF5050618.1 hypothetical protein [Candidatus Clavichlamydia salmonicola]
MSDKNQKEIISALKHILSLYNIDVGDALEKDPESTDFGLDYAAIIEKTQEKINILQKQSNDILKKTGMSPEEIERYTTNPDNFSKEQWEALTNVKEACNKYKKETETLLNNIEKNLPKKEILEKFDLVDDGSQQINKKKKWISL